jgi:nitrate reductase delta subunit
MNNISSVGLNSSSHLYELFADIFEYPTSAICDQARESISVLAPIDDSVCMRLKKFLTFVEENPASRLEDVYTRTFDLQAVCIPYAGCHMFGEDPIRGMFMARLRELYRSHNINQAGELPDHISVMLRFLSVGNRGEESRELIDYCLIPSVRKMVKCFGERENPYHGVLEALLLVLERDRGKDVQSNDELREEIDCHE